MKFFVNTWFVADFGPLWRPQAQPVSCCLRCVNKRCGGALPRATGCPRNTRRPNIALQLRALAKGRTELDRARERRKGCHTRPSGDMVPDACMSGSTLCECGVRGLQAGVPVKLPYSTRRKQFLAFLGLQVLMRLDGNAAVSGANATSQVLRAHVLWRARPLLCRHGG